jgi:hypothetical protein
MVMSVLPLIADISRRQLNVSFGPILLQKSGLKGVLAGPRIF